MRGIGIRWLSAVLALGWASAGAQVTPEFDVSIRGVAFNARQDFLLPSQYANWSDYGGTEIRPRFVIRPLTGRPILGAEPRLRLTRLVAAGGQNLLDAGARAIIGDEYSRERPKYLFYAERDDGVPRAASYEQAMEPWTMKIVLPGLPSELEVVEGEMTLEVVEEDATREFTMGDAPVDMDLVPGLHLHMDPKSGHGGRSRAWYTIDPAKAGDRTPTLNFIRYTCAGLSDLVPFKPAMRPNGVMGGITDFDLQGLGYDKPAFFAHIVYRARTVTIPFRIEHVPITRYQTPAGPTGVRGRTASLDIVESHDDYDVRLVRLMAGGEQSTATVKAARPASLRLRLGVLETTGKRSFGRFMACHIDELTDESGKPVGQLTESNADDGRNTGGGERFTPKPALDVGQVPYTEAGHARMILVTLPMDAIPPRLGTLRGRMEFEEVTKDIVRDVELKPSPDPIELAPGVRVIVRDPALQPNVLPPQPRGDWVEVQVDLPPGTSHARNDSAAPMLNMVQHIDADGKAQPPESSFGVRREGDRLVYAVGQMAYLRKAASIRLHVVLETTTRTLPFDFKDVPCADR